MQIETKLEVETVFRKRAREKDWDSKTVIEKTWGNVTRRKLFVVENTEGQKAMGKNTVIEQTEREMSKRKRHRGKKTDLCYILSSENSK